MRILVTGGAGYIGAHTVRALLRRGMEPVIYDNLSTGHRDFVPQEAAFREGDVRDEARMRGVIREFGITRAVHFAALSLVGQDALHPDVYHDVNVNGTKALLRALAAEGAHRIVVSSSASVYGIADAEVITEEAPLQPVSVYGTTKVAMERAIVEASTPVFSWMALRYFNAAGASDDASIGERHDPETHLVPLALRAAAGTGKALTLFGDDYPTPDGTPIRDYVHVEDLADAHVAAILSDVSAAVNLGSGRGTSVKEMIAEAGRVVGRPVPLTVGARRQGDPPKLVASNALARELLDWRPTRGLAEIVSSAWRWERSRAWNGAS